MKRVIVPLIMLVGLIGIVQAQICKDESFDVSNGLLYGLQNLRGDRHAGTCSYPVSWEAGSKWCVEHVGDGGDTGAGDGAAHIITRSGQNQFNQGWYWGAACDNWSASNGDIMRIKLKIKFDSRYSFNTGGQNNKFMIWGSDQGGKRMILFLRDGYWTASDCRPYGSGSYPRCGNDGSDCSSGGHSQCVSGTNVQYCCVPDGTYQGKGVFTVGAGISTPCTGPANAGTATGFGVDEWVYMQTEVKTGPNGYIKMWVNNNNQNEPNACTGSAAECPASATYGYPAGRGPVSTITDTDVSNWGGMQTIGDFVTDALPQDMGFYLDDMVWERNGTFDSNWVPGGGTTPGCDDGSDNDGDGLTDYPADPGCQSASDNDERGSAACDDGADNDGDGLSDFRLSGGDPGCASASDSDENNCGNGTIEGNEACDGSELGGQTCQSRGYDSGTLGCAAGCESFDEGACVGSSGGGSINTLFTSDFEQGDWSEWNGRQEQTPGGLQVVADAGCPSGGYCARALLTQGTNSDNYADYYFGDFYTIGNPKVEEVWLSLKVKFDSGYVWPNSGQKVAILNATDGATSQRRYQVILKVAPEGDWSLQHSYIDTWQFFEKRQNVGTAQPVVQGQWVKLKVYARMNTPGASDGIIRMWVDDVLKAEYTSLDLRQSTDNGFGKLNLSSWATDASGSNGAEWYDDWVMAESDPDSAVPPPDGNPATPDSVWRTDTKPSGD